MNRSALRKIFRRLRSHVTATQERQAATLITQQVLTLPEFHSNQRIAFYCAHHHEVNPAGILEHAWDMKKNSYLPVLQKDSQQLFFARYLRSDILKKNHCGILEPQTHDFIRPEELDIVFVPLFAFDEQGNRLGSGKGYYDRTFYFLKNTKIEKPYLIGLAYEFQKTKEFKAESWDIPLNKVITEKQIYTFEHNSIHRPV